MATPPTARETLQNFRRRGFGDDLIRAEFKRLGIARQRISRLLREESATSSRATWTQPLREGAASAIDLADVDAETPPGDEQPGPWALRSGTALYDLASDDDMDTGHLADAGCYVGPGPPPPRGEEPIRGGFVNDGNTCYLAATVHAMLAVPSVALAARCHLCCDECPEACPCAALQTSEATSREGRVSDVRHWKPVAQDVCHLAWGAQQSPHEFYMGVAENMPDADREVLEVRLRTVTQGLCSCGPEPTENVEVHTLVNLHMDDVAGRGSLEEALASHERWTFVESADYKCDVCKQHCDLRRRVLREAAGDAVAVSLSRETVGGLKDRTQIAVSSAVRLGLADWRLRAVVVHHGDYSQQGHYVAYVRDRRGGYLLYDDAQPPRPMPQLPDMVHTDGVFFMYDKHDSDVPDEDAGHAEGSSIGHAVVKREPVSPAPVNRKNSPRPTVEDRRRIRNMVDRGVPQRRIAEELGVSRHAVQYLPTTEANAAHRADQQKRVDAMRGDGHTQQQIAEALNVDISTVRRAFGRTRDLGSARDAWIAEFANAFSITDEMPSVSHWPTKFSAKQTAWLEEQWIAEASWIFCPFCGRRRPLGQLVRAWTTRGRLAVEQPCRPYCDLRPEVLQKDVRPAQGAEKKKKAAKLEAYVTPNKEDWPAVFLTPDGAPALNAAERASLSLVLLDATYNSARGGDAPVTSKKKLAVIKATWREDDVEAALPTERARNAFAWLVEHNPTYREYLQQQRRARADRGEDRGWRIIRTAQLLLNMPGIEVAARPWLYPLAEFGDSDIKVRLVPRGRLGPKQTPSVKTSFYHKLVSRCVSYQEDFALQCLLYDISLARRISSVVNLAKAQKRAPDDLTADMQNFSAYWDIERAKLEDVCRQQEDMPNLFFTVAPGEWKFPVHQGMLQWRKQQGDKAMTNAQAVMTLHMHHVMVQIIERLMAKSGICGDATGIERVKDYSMRFEFQGRGTVHVHVVAWVDLKTDLLRSEEEAARRLCGVSGQPHDSKLVAFLERIFKGSVDVQVGRGEHCLLRYVTGYVSKASDSLRFNRRESESAQGAQHATVWKQIYRMLCKKAPLEPEMVLEIAGAPLMVSSYRGDYVYAPIPGHRDVVNNSRHLYNAYQQVMAKLPDDQLVSYIQWAREHRCEPIKPRNEGEPYSYKVKVRGVVGAGADKLRCALGVRFPWERLDIFIGAYCAMFIPHRSEDEFVLSEEEAANTPEGTRFLRAALRLPRYGNNLELLKDDLKPELRLRGVSSDNQLTFFARLNACKLLLDACRSGIVDPASWSARRPTTLPVRAWSPQQQAVLDAVAEGLSVVDANVPANSRFLHVTGGPGTGKTEVVVQCAVNAATEDEARVLIGCPIGALLDTYRLRLPPRLNIVVETIHSAFRITRWRDQVYVPPGRLRQYDLIIFDEVSQIDAHVWEEVRTALDELVPGPFIVFVGDFQQLQPVDGETSLRDALDLHTSRDLRKIELQQHEFARCRDPEMLDFLLQIRTQQPSRRDLERFFYEGILPKNPELATREALELEAATQRRFTFLTVTNEPAAALNRARVDREFPHVALRPDTEFVRGDENAGGGRLTFAPGMRIRLTRNIAKDRGFVNGALGTVEHVLQGTMQTTEERQGSPYVTHERVRAVVLRDPNDVRILVHQVHLGGRTFWPAAYAYATTIRRAQGMTLDMVGLRFDLRLPDRGYAYVGASRVRRRCDLYHVGKLRRTDWLPVGRDDRGEGFEQTYPSTYSWMSDSNDDRSHSDTESLDTDEECYRPTPSSSRSSSEDYDRGTPSSSRSEADSPNEASSVDVDSEDPGPFARIGGQQPNTDFLGLL